MRGAQGLDMAFVAVRARGVDPRAPRTRFVLAGAGGEELARTDDARPYAAAPDGAWELAGATLVLLPGGAAGPVTLRVTVDDGAAPPATDARRVVPSGP